MKLTKENILSVCEKYLFIFYKNEKYGYWEDDSPRQIHAINKYGFICYNYRNPYYFTHYLDDNCKIFISDDWHNNYASLEDMNTDEEVDKESLKNFINCIDNEYCVVYNQEYVNKLNKRIYELQKENNELNKENGKLEGFLEDERMECCELKISKNNEIKELKDKAKKIIKELMYFCEDYTTIGITEENRSINSKNVYKQAEDFLKELEND